MTVISKTPKFNKVLEEYFSKLKLDEYGGRWRTCRFSGEKFYVRPEDIEFYKKMRVSLPTLEPEERRRRRFSIHNSYNLYKGISGFSGKKIVTLYPPGSPFVFYEHQIWYSDAWDPMQYGKSFDQNVEFFRQFHELQLAIPRPALVSDVSNVNSDYTTGSRGIKNCYLVFEQNGGEDLYYHQCCLNDKNCIDCWALDDCDTCYASKVSKKLYKCFFCEETKDTIESAFLWDCRNCEHCFMSSGLRNKKYCFRNECIGKGEYERRMRNIYFGKFSELQKLKEEFQKMKLEFPRKENWNERAENSLGDYIKFSKNAHLCLYAENCENISYSEGLVNARDTCDTFGGNNSELCYEVSNVWDENCFNVKFSTRANDCRDVEYSDFCDGCENCFGCVGLRHKQFCVFNTQYTEEEYWKLVDEIKTHMLRREEYGEFFPPQYAPFPYQASINMSYPGFQDLENAKKYGYNVSPILEVSEAISDNTIEAKNLPDDVKDVDDSILSKVIIDENGKQFRLIKQELDFYRIYGLPIPRKHPSTRIGSARAGFNIRLSFYTRSCGRCGKTITTSYPPNAPEKNIWCEKCYLDYIG